MINTKVVGIKLLTPSLMMARALDLLTPKVLDRDYGDVRIGEWTGTDCISFNYIGRGEVSLTRDQISRLLSYTMTAPKTKRVTVLTIKCGYKIGTINLYFTREDLETLYDELSGE
jgi:hypothetical protein